METLSPPAVRNWAVVRRRLLKWTTSQHLSKLFSLPVKGMRVVKTCKTSMLFGQPKKIWSRLWFISKNKQLNPLRAYCWELVTRRVKSSRGNSSSKQIEPFARPRSSHRFLLSLWRSKVFTAQNVSPYFKYPKNHFNNHLSGFARFA